MTKRAISASVLACIFLFSACDQSSSLTPEKEGKLLFLGYRYLSNGSAYVSADSNEYMGSGYAADLDSSPYLKIYGSWCELTWKKPREDGSIEDKVVCFPTSNIYSFRWKE